MMANRENCGACGLSKFGRISIMILCKNRATCIIEINTILTRILLNTKMQYLRAMVKHICPRN